MFYINMELKFGNESSVQAVKERAMKCNDQKKVLDNLVEIYSSQQNCEVIIFFNFILFYANRFKYLLLFFTKLRKNTNMILIAI